VRSETKHAIMQWLKNNTEDPDVRKGRLMIQHDITRFFPPPYNVLAQKESTLLHLYPAYQHIDDFYRDLSQKKITSRSVLQKLWSEEELLYSPTKIVVRSTGSRTRYVTIRIHMRRDPRGLSKLLHVFFHMNIALEAIRKRDEVSVNRIQYSFLCRMPSFDTLYTLCEQFDKNPEIESIIKE
jgi:(p)ppGpp synthase/HD superfamily hydrolase